MSGQCIGKTLCTERKVGESLLKLEQVIRRLVNLAFPNAPERVLDTLAFDSFLNSLTKSEVLINILRARPFPPDETLQIAVKLDACMKAEEKRAGKQSKAVREVDTETTRKQDDGRDAEIKQLMQMQTQWKSRANPGRVCTQTIEEDIICFNRNHKGRQMSAAIGTREDE